jgi:hypothetical protein
LIAVFYKLVVEQTGHRQRPGGKGIFLILKILGIELVQVNFRQVAVEV